MGEGEKMIRLEIRNIQTGKRLELKDLTDTGRYMLRHELDQMLEELEELQ